MIENMDDAEAQASSRRTLRLIKSPEPGPLSRREAGSISNDLSRIGLSISAERLQEISTTGRATRNEAEVLRAWRQHLDNDVEALHYRAWWLQKPQWKLWGYALVVLGFAVLLYAVAFDKDFITYLGLMTQ